MIRYVCTMLISLAITPCLHAMEIFLQLPNNQIITLEVESSDTIENLKQKTTDQTAIPQGQQIMLFEGKRLLDGRTLADYNVQKEATIELALIAPNGDGILYVRADAPAGGAGESWDNALPSLAEALDAARSLNEVNAGTVQQIWVAAGEYQPAGGQSFTMVEAVGIYGGFTGDETALEQRDWRNNETVLRGNGNIVVSNSFPKEAPLSGSAVLDGFTITGGSSGLHGGGVVTRYASPILSNLIITGNEAARGGGGIFIAYSSPVLRNVLITGNSAVEGGGVYHTLSSALVFTQVTVSGNTASKGAEFYNATGTPIIRNSIIWGNGVAGQLYDTRYSLVQGQTEADNGGYYDPDNHNVSSETDPLFAGADVGDFTLQPGSPTVDAGDPSTNEPGYGVQAGDTDLAGRPRIRGGGVDMGAYEVEYTAQQFTPDANGILYVRADGPAEGTGEDWSNALPSLAEALDAARSLNAVNAGTVQQIWVAAGEYQPAIDQSFTMVEAVGIYGGFTGDETALEQRDWRNNETVLRGNGLNVFKNNFRSTAPLSGSAVLDGFTITGGGGMTGGGMYNWFASPTLSNLIITGNWAYESGGGIYIASDSAPTLRNVLISGNSTNNFGGGVSNYVSSPVFIQVTVSGNSSRSNRDAEWRNTGGTPIIRNSIIWGNGVDGQLYDTRYSLVQGQTEADNAAYYDPANHNLDPTTDPLFFGADVGDFTLQPGSPTVDAGDPRTNEPGYAIQAGDTDLAGRLRIYSGRVDMGAYEMQTLHQLINPIDNITGTYGDPAITLGGTATSGLAVGYASSDNSIAEVFQDAVDGDAWKIRILNLGSVTITASQPGDPGYYLPADDVTFTLTVNPRPVTVDFAAGATLEKEYDGTAEARALASGFALEGIVDGDEVWASLSVSQAAYDTKEAGTDKAVTVPLANVGLTGADANNYSIGNTADITADIGTITKKGITVTARNAAKVYEGEAYSGGNGVDYEGFVAGEDALVLDGTLTYGGTAQGATEAGDYSITASGLTATNYTLEYRPGTLTISGDAENILSFNVQEVDGEVARTYGDGDVDGSAVASSGLAVEYSSSDEAVAVVDGNGQVSIHGVGTAMITAMQRGNANYAAVDPVSFSITVGKKGLTVTARNATKVYDGAAYSGGNGVDYTGFVTGEDESALDGTLTYGGPAQGAVAVGSYAIVPTGLVSANYAITYRSGSLSVTKRPVTVVFGGGSTLEKVYDGTTSGSITPESLAFAAGDLLGGDELQVALTAGMASYATAEAGTAKAVTVPLANVGLTGADASNYSIGNTADITADVGKITKKGITVTARNAAKVYDGAAYRGGNGVDYEGFVAGEDESVLDGTLTYGGTAQGAVAVGSYAILSAGLSAANYAIDYAAGTLTVSPATRSITFPLILAKVYGAADFDGDATASSSEAITYTSSDTAVAEVTADGTIHITGAGTATISATVPENGNYGNRPEATQLLTVHKGTQAISLHAPAQVNRDAGIVQLDVSSSSGLPVSLGSDDPEVAMLSGTALDILRLGTVRITATQAGDANYEAADPVTVTLRVVDPTSDMPVRIHQAVSPNGDGINEYLIIEAIKDYPDNRVSIFNRNGTVVYEASGYNNGTVAFRGIGAGQLRVAAGTYFYVTEIKDGDTIKYEKGWFVLRY